MVLCVDIIRHGHHEPVSWQCALLIVIDVTNTLSMIVVDNVSDNVVVNVMIYCTNCMIRSMGIGQPG